MLLVPILTLGQDSEIKQERKTEIDFLASYYEQDGDHSAVTGGQGTEVLHDYAGIVIINVPIKENNNMRIESGVSYFTSASHDNINPNTISSASYDDVTTHIDVTYSTLDTAKRYSVGINGRVSVEMYFGSVSVGGFYSWLSRDLNREFKLSANLFMDKWALFYPISNLYPSELKSTGIDYVDHNKRYSANFNATLSQIVNEKLQVSFSLGAYFQTGLLSAPYHRVYFSDEQLPGVERLPDSKVRIPISARLHYFMGDRFIFRTFYRYYWDTFEIDAHTFQIEVPYKINNFLAFQPFYRIHFQNGTKYFAPYKIHTSDQEYYTSDYDLSSFDSQFFGAGIKYSPALGIGKFRLSKKSKKHYTFREFQLRGGRYLRSDDMRSWMVSFGLSFVH